MGARPFVADTERRRRLARRHLLRRDTATDDVAAIADALVGLHSSDPATVYLAAVTRMAHPDLRAVDNALYDDRTVVRHHAMRRTMWVMTPATARHAHSATTLKIAAAERRRTLAALAGTPGIGDPDAWLTAATREIVDLLASGGPMTARQVGQALPHRTAPLVFGTRTRHPGSIPAHTKVLQLAGFDGRLVRTRPVGTWISSEYAWAVVEDWLGAPLTGRPTREGAAALLDHWLHRFGPGTETDIRWWFGWTVAVMRDALSDIDAIPVDVESGGPAWLAADDSDDSDEPVAAPRARLLPGLDPTTMGWKDRAWYVDPAMVPRLFDRFGNAGPTIWVDGRVVGGWIQRADGEIALDVLEPIGRAQRAAIGDAVDELSGALNDVVIRPRFPSPNQRELLTR